MSIFVRFVRFVFENKIRVNPCNLWETNPHVYHEDIFLSQIYTDYFSTILIFIFSHGSHGSHGFYPPPIVAKLTTKSVSIRDNPCANKNIREIREITSLWSVGLRRVSCSKIKSVSIRGRLKLNPYYPWETRRRRRRSFSVIPILRGIRNSISVGAKQKNLTQWRQALVAVSILFFLPAT